MLGLFKNKTEIDKLRKEFYFLEKDFGYQIVKQETKDFYKGKNLIVFKNKGAKKQIEICGGLFYFNCIIRELKNGILAEYSNCISNIDIEDLAMIDDPDYATNEFYPYGKSGFMGPASRTKELFIRQKRFLTSTEWVDINRIDFLKNITLNSRFKKVKDNKPEFFIDKIRIMIYSHFPSFKLVFDNKKLPSYHKNSTIEKLIYETENKVVKIEQYDYRDFPDIYELFLNDAKMKEIDISLFDDKNLALLEIQNAFNTVYSA